MFTTAKPTWLLHQDAFQEVIDYNLYPPSDVHKFFSLPDSEPAISGVKQFLHWKGQLLPSLNTNTIFLAFLGPKGLVKPNVINLVTALRAVCDIHSIIETHQGANNNFIAFSFKNAISVEQIISNFKYYEDSIVLPISQATAADHRFRLLWLPPLFDTSRVHHLLNSITSSHRIRRESLALGIGIFSPTNVISGILTLKNGQTVEQLPHLIKLPSPHRGCALLTVEGRQPMCLKCRIVGHTRRTCNMTRCDQCHKVHFPDSPCGTSSYSAVASKNITTYLEDDWMHLLSDSSASEEPTHTTKDTRLPLSSSEAVIIPDPSITASLKSPAVPNLPSIYTHDAPFANSNTVTKPEKQAKKPKEPITETPVIFSPSTVLNNNASSSRHSSTVADYSRTKSSSKVQVLSKSAALGRALKSDTLPFTPLSSKDPSHKSASGIIFGDPILESCFDSSDEFFTESESPQDTLQEEDMVLDSVHFSGSRKRKGSPSMHSEDLTTSSSPPSVKHEIISLDIPSYCTLDDPSNSSSYLSFTELPTPAQPYDDTSHATSLLHCTSAPTHPSTPSSIPTHDAPLSSCTIVCLKCSENNSSSFPPTSLRLCYKCYAPLTSRNNKRFYPIPDASELIVSLSTHDLTVTSTTQYISNVHKLKAHITFI